MKITTKIMLGTCVLMSVLLGSCKEGNIATGSSILESSDLVMVDCDTFRIQSAIIAPDTLGYYIYSTPDSFLLGECDSRFGTIHADILTQFSCPVNFRYPDGAEVDSVLLYFYYTSWHGDGLSPISISVYEMDKNTFQYSGHYSNHLDVNDYCSLHDSTNVLYSKRILVPARPTDSVYTASYGRYLPFVKMRLTDEFAKRLFARRNFSSLEAYNQQFKGLFIQSNFGSASLLHVSDINMAIFYHFTYQKNGRDTTVNDIKGLYANTEVRQVNRFVYYNQAELISKLDTIGKDYIVSPANLYTRVGIPIRAMADSISRKVNGKRPYINKAELQLDVLNHHSGSGKKTRDEWAQPAEHMLMILEDSINVFFAENRLPSDTCALLAQLSSSKTGDSTVYYYRYDMSALLTRAVRLVHSAASDSVLNAMVPEYLNMLLVPATVGYTSTSNYSSGSISSVKHEQTVTATVIRSASSAEKPLNLEVVYSGF